MTLTKRRKHTGNLSRPTAGAQRQGAPSDPTSGYVHPKEVDLHSVLTATLFTTAELRLSLDVHLGHPLLISLAHEQGAGSGVEHLEHELVPLWDANISGCCFACCATIPAPSNDLIKNALAISF